MTQIIEMPPGALLPPEPPASAAAPSPQKTDRRGIALAIGLGLLAGALVLLLLAGVVRSRHSSASAVGTPADSARP